MADMNVLMVAAEAVPFAKVGGLADVAGALPRALRARGLDARLILPCYRRVFESPEITLNQNGPHGLKIYLLNTEYEFSIKTAQVQGVPVYLLDMPFFFHRENVYNYFDDVERFAAFCKGVLEALKSIEWAPDVIHCNDWHTALIPALLGTVHAEHPYYARMGRVFSIHNLAYQGRVPPRTLDLLGLPWSEFNHHRAEFYGGVNILKAGIFHAHRIGTVSPTYAKEILTEESGEGLDGMLRAHQDRLRGILNGIDTVRYDPAADTHIASNFSADNFAARTANKKALLKEMGLPAGPRDVESPVMGMITRLAKQKGLDLVHEALDDLLAQNVKLVILGSGAPDIEDMLQQAASRFPNKMALRLGFDEALAHRIYAGCDMFLMPSRFEPCGLGQLMAMRYGAVPVVRATGGLADTVTNFAPATLKGNGFSFKPYTAKALTNAVRRALDVYSNAGVWQQLAGANMKLDWSWDASAAQYEQLYSEALSERDSKS